MPAAVGVFVGWLGSLGAGVAATFGVTLAATAGAAVAIGSTVLALTAAGIRRAAGLRDSANTGRIDGQKLSVRSTKLPRNIVFGETQVGGLISYFNTTGDELRSLYFEIAHTGHEIDSFVGWYIDDKYVPVADVDTAGDGSVDADPGGTHGLIPYISDPVLYLRGALGTDSQAVDSMLDSAFAEIDSNHRHRGCARTVARCDLVPGGEDRWQGRAPQSITAVVRGAKCYDPRLDSTFSGGSGSHRLATPSTWEWTDNPALIWARYRTMAKPLGPAWDTSRIDWQSVFDAANACDVSVAIPTATTEKRFRCDLVVDTSMEPQTVVDKILATMGGKERQFNGLWHVYAATFPSTDFALTESDLIGEVQYRKQPQIEDRYNQVKPSYIDRDRVWKRSQAIAVNNTTLRTNRDNGRVLPKELELDGVSREYQAQRLGIRALNQADDTGILVFPTGYNGLNIRVGDTGTVTIDELGFSSKVFRCVGWKWVDFVGAELTLKEDASGNYSDPIEAEYSTRTPAGDIVFGTVLPWYLLAQPGLSWMADSEGRPAGIRGVENVADRAQLLLLHGTMVILSTPDTQVGFGFPAVPVSDSLRYEITVRHNSSAASADGYYIRMNELAGALPAGKTHVGVAAAAEAVVEDRDSYVDLVADGPFPSLTTTKYVYTPTAGTQLASLSFYNWDPATAGAQLYIDRVAMTEVGTNIQVLPGLVAQTDTSGLVPGAATATYTDIEPGPVTHDDFTPGVDLCSISGLGIDANSRLFGYGSVNTEQSASFTTLSLVLTWSGGSATPAGAIAYDPVSQHYSTQAEFPTLPADTSWTMTLHAGIAGGGSATHENASLIAEVVKR